MRRALTAIFLTSSAPLMAAEVATAPPPVEQNAAMRLLPTGSTLIGAVIPRYDEDLNLVGVLKSASITILGDGKFSGQPVAILLYYPDGRPRGSMDLAQATFAQDKSAAADSLLRGTGTTTIRTDRMTATGTGLLYSFARHEGFLLGPGTTTLTPKPATQTTMPFPTFRPAALLGLSLLTTQPLAADENSTTLDALIRDLTDAQSAGNAAAKFLAEAKFPTTPTTVFLAPTAPLQLPPASENTVITCEGGSYFNAEEGVLVYLGNVTVRNPDYHLSGANELKIFLEKKPATPEPKSKSKPATPGGDLGKKFGEVERIVATGAVLFEQQKAASDKKPAPGKDPISASGAVLTYNKKTDKIVIQGGYPWVRQGANAMRALEPKLLLTISPKAGDFVTQKGRWETSVKLKDTTKKTNP